MTGSPEGAWRDHAAELLNQKVALARSNLPFQGSIACARVESGVLTANDTAANYLLGPLATPGDGQVTLKWNVSGSSAGYFVKQALTSGGPYSMIATNISSLSSTNIDLANGTLYYYVVSATNSAGASANSSEVSARPTSSTGRRSMSGFPPANCSWAGPRTTPVGCCRHRPIRLAPAWALAARIFLSLRRNIFFL